MPGGSMLARLLAKERKARDIGSLSPLSVDQILTWADARHARTGVWPTLKSGPIPEAPGEKWLAVENALRMVLRGLQAGSSLYKLLARERGIGRDAFRREGNGQSSTSNQGR
jgi:hypothetical protein